MNKPVLLAATDFCRLVDIDVKRFEQRRLRERAVTDLAETVDAGEDYRLPIAPTEPGKHARFDALDAIRMRAVIELERGGMSFSAACNFLLSSGVAAYLSHQGGDFFIARWLEGATVRHTYGTDAEIARAMPAAPKMAVKVNLSAVADEVAKRAAAQLGLILKGGQFFRGSHQ